MSRRPWLPRETFARVYAPTPRPSQLSKIAPPPPPAVNSKGIPPLRRDSTETQVDEEAEEEEPAEEEAVLTTPRMKPAKEPLSVGTISYDSTMATFAAE